jgi:hypothetical protein
MDKKTIEKGGYLKAEKSHRTAARQAISAATEGFSREQIMATVFEAIKDPGGERPNPRARQEAAHLATIEEINDQLAQRKIEWLGSGRFRKR